jgi:hypothetical protein
MSATTPQPELAPTKRTDEYARLMRWFGFWFVASLAPFLGTMKIPGFRALIELYPDSLQNWLIPLSGIFMGMMAVIVEFAAAKAKDDDQLTRWFIRDIVIFGMSLILLVSVYIFTVVHVSQRFAAGPNEPAKYIQQTVITGSRSVPAQWSGSDCKCRQGQPATRCLASISLNPNNIETCFGSTWIGVVTLALVLLYLAVTGSFAAAVGLLVIARRSLVKASNAEPLLPSPAPPGAPQ